LTDRNEERQLRLGLVQVLRYRALLDVTRSNVRAVFVAERPPHDQSWEDLCESLGVLLVSPASFARILI
jgi:hypothetical protein